MSLISVEHISCDIDVGNLSDINGTTSSANCVFYKVIIVNSNGVGVYVEGLRADYVGDVASDKWSSEQVIRGCSSVLAI